MPRQDLGEVRHAAAGRRADVLGVDRQFAPAQHAESFFEGQFLQRADGLRPLREVLGQEGGSGRVVPGGRKGESGDGAEEGVGDLGEEAGTVTGAVVGAYGAAVFEPAQGGQGGVNDVVPRLPPQRGDDGEAAGVLLLLRVVEPGRFGKRREALER